MTFYENSNYYNSINIYTDTSDKRVKDIKGIDEIKLTCPGFIATYNSKILYQASLILIDEYTIVGEAKAIEMAINWIGYMITRGCRFRFNIFCDNFPVTILINNVINNFSNTLKEDTVAKIICNNVARSIMLSTNSISVYYVPGHIEVKNNLESINKYKKKFIEYNSKIHKNLDNVMDSLILFEAATFNNIIDLTTRNFLYQHIDQITEDLKSIPDLEVFIKNKNINLIAWPFNETTTSLLSSSNLLLQ